MMNVYQYRIDLSKRILELRWVVDIIVLYYA